VRFPSFLSPCSVVCFYRLFLTSLFLAYDPFGDPKANGDPYCTVFVGRLSRQTDEDTLRKVSYLAGTAHVLACSV
jgi:hypothetical protein